ncbi:hypothetical protein FGK63_20410 [Ruegeria sediminis]|uniref:Secreted protein n=1 Tax=Ruegeria sediminis TaxID=2583820 RepID=A0ABY2WS28_9RHOB|nr:hypothetical protein [Ruegeria sediminis]TMV02593.1 hypothetical protein FGK63_20410 [Ruegeria sediminis]
MKNTIASAAALLLTTAAASAEICFLQIDGQIEMQGPCVFDPMGGGDFFAADIDDRLAFVYFYLEDSGIGIAAWSDRESKANSMLGTLYRDGACWQNPDVTLCAWDS